MENNFFLNEIYPTLEKNLSDKVKSNNLQDYIKKFIDKNNNVLFHTAPSKRLYFNEDHEMILYKSCNVHPDDIMKIIRRSTILKESWRTFNKAFYWLGLLAARYYQIKGNEKELYSTLTFTALKLYSSIQYKFFRFEPNENVMDYTINTLSYKYDIKKYGTMFKLIFETVKGNHEKYQNLLKRGTDEDFKNYLIALWTRLNSKIKNIKSGYMNIKDQGLYLNTDEETEDKETGLKRDVDNTSLQITKIAEKMSNRFITGNLDDKIIRIAAESCGISQNILKTAIYNIIGKKYKEVNLIFTYILQIFTIDEAQNLDNILSKDFLVKCINVYNRSNTTNQRIISLKNLLDEWLVDCSDKYATNNREATKGAYKKAVFMYFVLYIQKSIN